MKTNRIVAALTVATMFTSGVAFTNNATAEEKQTNKLDATSTLVSKENSYQLTNPSLKDALVGAATFSGEADNKEHKVTFKLMKATKDKKLEPVLINDKEVTTEETFKFTEKDQKVETTFDLDTTKLKDESLVLTYTVDDEEYNEQTLTNTVRVTSPKIETKQILVDGAIQAHVQYTDLAPQEKVDVTVVELAEDKTAYKLDEKYLVGATSITPENKSEEQTEVSGVDGTVDVLVKQTKEEPAAELITESIGKEVTVKDTKSTVVMDDEKQSAIKDMEKMTSFTTLTIDNVVIAQHDGTDANKLDIEDTDEKITKPESKSVITKPKDNENPKPKPKSVTIEDNKDDKTEQLPEKLAQTGLSDQISGNWFYRLIYGK